MSAVMSTKLKSLADVDKALLRLQKATLALQDIDSAAEEEASKIYDAAEKKGKKFRKTIEEIDQDIRDFAENNKAEYFPKDGESRTQKLTFGKLSYKQSSEVVIEDEEKTAKLIRTDQAKKAKKLGIDAAVEMVPKISKTVLKKFSKEDLAFFGVKIDEKDNFSYKVDEKAVNLNLAGKGK